MSNSAECRAQSVPLLGGSLEIVKHTAIQVRQSREVLSCEAAHKQIEIVRPAVEADSKRGEYRSNCARVGGLSFLGAGLINTMARRGGLPREFCATEKQNYI